jgi:hypothetical protein
MKGRTAFFTLMCLMPEPNWPGFPTAFGRISDQSRNRPHRDHSRWSWEIKPSGG